MSFQHMLKRETRTVAFNVDHETYRLIEQQAAAEGLTVAAYAKLTVCEQFYGAGKKRRLDEERQAER